jgi:hypothetical protein
MRILALAAVVVITACSKTGSITGDVYFTTPAGPPVRAAGVVVRLLAHGDSAAEELRALCTRYHDVWLALSRRKMEAMSGAFPADPSSRDGLARFIRAASLADSMADSTRLLAEETLNRTSALFSRRISDSVVTRIDAHFRFEKLRPGSYGLLAQGLFGERPRTWFATAKVVERDSTVQDLAPQHENDTGLPCNIATDALGVAHSNDAAVVSARARIAEMDAEGKRRGEEVAELDAIDARSKLYEAAGTTIYQAHQVTQQAQLDPSSTAFKYPHVQGQPDAVGIITATFVVGPDGRVDAATVTEMTSSESRFDAVFREALSKVRYRPAKIGNRQVMQRVRERFEIKPKR